MVESLWAKSRRVSVTLAYALATLSLALARFADPFSLRLSAFCALRSFLAARRRKRGLAIFRPSEVIAKWVSPRSMPISGPVSGNGSSAVSTTNDAK